MNTIHQNSYIKKFMRQFKSSKEIIILKYLAIIGIDYVNRYMKNSSNLENDMRRITCRVFNCYLIILKSVFRKIKIQTIKKIKKLNKN